MPQKVQTDIENTKQACNEYLISIEDNSTFVNKYCSYHNKLSPQELLSLTSKDMYDNLFIGCASNVLEFVNRDFPNKLGVISSLTPTPAFTYEAKIINFDANNFNITRITRYFKSENEYQEHQYRIHDINNYMSSGIDLANKCRELAGENSDL